MCVPLTTPESTRDEVANSQVQGGSVHCKAEFCACEGLLQGCLWPADISRPLSFFTLLKRSWPHGSSSLIHRVMQWVVVSVYESLTYVKNKTRLHSLLKALGLHSKLYEPGIPWCSAVLFSWASTGRLSVAAQCRIGRLRTDCGRQNVLALWYWVSIWIWNNFSAGN